MKPLFKSLCLAAFTALATFTAAAGEPWQDALAAMPLGTNPPALTRTNTVGLMLTALRANDTVKGIVFMPGATDELYFFRRVNVPLAAGAAPTLLDCVTAITNHSYILATYRAPFLLLHTTEDHLGGFATVQSPRAEKRLRGAVLARHFLFNDRDWDDIYPLLQANERATLAPGLNQDETCHFYRHSFAAWNLTQWELLEATAYAGKTTFTLTTWNATFTGDRRHGPIPAENTIRMHLD